MNRGVLQALLLCAAVFTAASASHAQTPAQIERQLISHLDTLGKASNYLGSSDTEVQVRENAAIRSLLIKHGNRADIIAYPFKRLERRIIIADSADHRFRVYSWDRESGGTMHDFENVFQYRGRSGKVRTWTNLNRDETGAGVFYTQVFQVPSGSGPVYVANYTFIGSTSYHGQGIEAYMIEGEKLVPNVKVFRTSTGLKSSISFGYDFFSVVDHPERPVKLFFFDLSKNSIRFPVVIEDKKTPQGRVTNKFITYRFDGKQFVRLG